MFVTIDTTRGVVIVFDSHNDGGEVRVRVDKVKPSTDAYLEFLSELSDCATAHYILPNAHFITFSYTHVRFVFELTD
jgi:hypothetical protein